MENGQYRHGIVFEEKVDRIGKPMEQPSTNAFTDDGELKRSLPDPIEKGGDLVGETAA
jgi:hypothetical protein